MLRRDDDGDYWFIDRLETMARTRNGAVPTPPVEDALYQLSEIELAAAFGVAGDASGQDVLAAAVVSRTELDGARITKALRRELEPSERPAIIRRVAEIPMNKGFRPIKTALRAAGLDPATALQTLRYDEQEQRYH
ncbi:MAG: hypothetical protein DRI90_25135 [Deltaproteobacteria bacterium]|nr:MAG: hypothetical protein DRI90_25135 [Deltaproteobacteria bacterium]